MKTRRNRAIEKANNELKYVESAGKIKTKEESIIAEQQSEVILPINYARPKVITFDTTASNPKKSTQSTIRIFESINKCLSTISYIIYKTIVIGFNNLIDKAKNYEKR